MTRAIWRCRGHERWQNLAEKYGTNAQLMEFSGILYAVRVFMITQIAYVIKAPIQYW